MQTLNDVDVGICAFVRVNTVWYWGWSLGKMWVDVCGR